MFVEKSGMKKGWFFGGIAVSGLRKITGSFSTMNRIIGEARY